VLARKVEGTFIGKRVVLAAKTPDDITRVRALHASNLVYGITVTGGNHVITVLVLVDGIKVEVVERFALRVSFGVKRKSALGDGNVIQGAPLERFVPTGNVDFLEAT